MQTVFEKLMLLIPSSGIVRKAAHVFLSNWVNIVVHFILGIYVARTFGAEGKGVYSLITAGASMIGISLSMSLNNATIYYVKQGDITPRAGILLILWNSLGVAFVVAIALFTFKDFVWSIFFNDIPFSYIFLAVIVVYIPILLLNLYLVSYYLAVHETGKHQTLVSTSAIVTLGATILLVSFFKMNITGALIALLLTEMICVIYFSLDICRKSLPADSRKLPIRELFSYGLRSHIGVLGNTVLTRIDLFIVTAYISPAALGYYSVATFLYQSILSVPNATNGLVFGAYCDRGAAEARRMNNKIVWSMAALLMAIAIPLFFFGGPFITFCYGNDFSRSVPTLNILLIAAVLIGVSSSYNSLFLACGYPQITSKIAVISGVVKVVMTFILVPRFSIDGAAMATVAAAVCICVMRVLYGRKRNFEMFNAHRPFFM